MSGVLRVRLLGRLVFALAGVAAFATVGALVLQDFSLTRDLDRAARERLQRVARSAGRLVEAHSRTVFGRYEAISHTPQFRANLEVEDPPTLEHYAAELLERHQGAQIFFLDGNGAIAARAGNLALDPATFPAEGATLVVLGNSFHTLVAIPLRTGDRSLGRLVALEPIESSTLDEWSELCNARVFCSPPGLQDDRDLEQVVHSSDGLELRVRTSFDAERLALSNNRANLLTAGALALSVALIASIFLSRGLVSSIRQIKVVTERIGRGEFEARLQSSRGDEIGDVARAVNDMARRLHDYIIELKRIERELQLAKERAEEGVRSKAEFLATMSHEIRTPMNAILGITSFLLDEEMSSEQREWLRMVRAAGESLLRILNDILDFSKIEAGKLDLVPRSFDLRELVWETVRTLGFRLQEKGLELILRVHRDVPATLFGDPLRLSQVFFNLVENAIKFTERGEVVVSIDNEKELEESVELHVTVADTGIGIPREAQARIFGVFEQADGSTTRHYGGTGLGLAICSRLVGMMGGRIWLESEPGLGSRFHFTTRLARQNGSSVPPVQVQPDILRELSVLVVDDNATVRRVLGETLAHWEMRPIGAADEKEAVRALQQAHSEGREIPIVLLDSKLGTLDGIAVAEAIRQEPRFDGDIVLMVTNEAPRQSDPRRRELGIAAFVHKPIRESELLAALLEIVGHREPIVQTEAMGSTNVDARRDLGRPRVG